MQAPHTNDNPFLDLPSALVQELLDQTQEVSKALLSSFQELKNERDHYREQLEATGLLRRETDLGYVDTPTTCGVDGAYVIERLIAVDLVAAAAVAMEGLTPPSETRYWPEPNHRAYINTESHEADSGTILRAIMMGLELELAALAPHDVVLLDGSLTTPIIFINQALNKVSELPQLKLSALLLDALPDILNHYHSILESKRSDKNWVAVPKYTTRREFGILNGWPSSYDDRAILTQLLQPGELTAPIRIEAPEEPWHLNTNPLLGGGRLVRNDIVAQLSSHLGDVRIAYYRPHAWLPALRLEMSPGSSENPARLAAILQAIKHQCRSPAVLEPFPLYMADRMVKALSRGVPALRQVTSQRLAENYSGNVQDIFLGLHSYRSETGR